MAQPATRRAVRFTFEEGEEGVGDVGGGNIAPASSPPSTIGTAGESEDEIFSRGTDILGLSLSRSGSNNS